MWSEGKTIHVEASFPSAMAQELEARGHKIVVENGPLEFGRGEIIWRTEYGTLCGATESRCDGCAAIV